MKRTGIIFFAFLLISNACSKTQDEDDHLNFVPGEVLVKTRNHFKIDDVFEFINSLQHEVESIKGGVYGSELPTDSLDYVLRTLNEKSYTNDGISLFTTGYISQKTSRITLFPKFYRIKDPDNQFDWIETMITLDLKEQTDSDINGYTILFHVKNGTEKEWEEKFEEYDFVAWSELNYIAEIGH